MAHVELRPAAGRAGQAGLAVGDRVVADVPPVAAQPARQDQPERGMRQHEPALHLVDDETLGARPLAVVQHRPVGRPVVEQIGLTALVDGRRRRVEAADDAAGERGGRVRHGIS